jgi:hypothetical protein
MDRRRYVQFLEIVMREPRPPSAEIAAEMGRPVGTFNSKISLMTLTRNALRPATVETINGPPSKDDYASLRPPRTGAGGGAWTAGTRSFRRATTTGCAPVTGIRR